MRIIAGEKRGLKLKTLEGLEVRPTLDHVKEALFNMIAFEIADKVVLDLFAGSGALGIEALSRGAKHAWFIDRARASGEVIRGNIALAGYAEKSTFILDDYQSFLEGTPQKFDIIFLDPPYGKNLIEHALIEINRNKSLNEGGILVCEFSVSEGYPSIPENFSIIKDKKYSKVKILILKVE